MNAKEPKIIIVGGKPVYDIRAFYCKEGRAKYISHLDLYRTVQRAFQRSKLPIWFTLGFNPHIYLTYALPLALGYEGVRESFDFRLTEDLPLEEAAARLNAAMPEGIVITELAPPVHKADDIEKADYTLEFSMKELSPEELEKAFTDYISQPAIETQKHTKKGPKTIDLKPSLLRCEVEKTDRGILLSLTLPAGIHENINPTLLIDAFGKAVEKEPDYHAIRRDRILCADGTEFC